MKGLGFKAYGLRLRVSYRVEGSRVRGGLGFRVLVTRRRAREAPVLLVILP